MLTLRIIFLLSVAYLFSGKTVTSQPAQNINHQNKSEILPEIGNHLIRERRGLGDSFLSWDPKTTTALATAISLLMCTPPPPKEKARCRIKVSTLNKKHSLILNPLNPSEFLYPDDEGYMEFEEGELVLLSCTTTEDITFEKISESVSKAFSCVCGDQFSADGRIYSFGDLGCTDVPRRHVRQDGEVEVFAKYQIGFQTTPNDFLNLIDIYYDSSSNQTMYVKETISKHKMGSQPTNVKNINFRATWHPFEDINEYYKKDNQIASFHRQLHIPNGTEVPYLRPDTNMLNRGHLAPKSSRMYTASAIATFVHLNAVPLFQKINAFNWAKIEEHAVTMAIEKKTDLVVVTGTYRQLQLPIGQSRNFADMYLYAVEQGEDFVQRVPIPLFVYKIIMDVENYAGVVYVTVNDPGMKVENKDSYYLCDRPFTRVDYIRSPRQWNPLNPTLGFSYACRVDEFLEKTQLPLLETPASNIDELLYLEPLSDRGNRVDLKRSV